MKYWVTRWTLTGGVRYQDLGTSAYDGYVWDGWNSHKIGKDAHDTSQSASDRVLKMIDAKLVSLEKQINKLVNLRIKVEKEGIEAVMKKENGT